MAQIEESVARYLHQLESADRQERSKARAMRINRLNDKIEKLHEEMARLEAIEQQREEQPDKQISFTDPDARSMATSGRGSGVVGYNVQAAVDTEHHLIVAHDVVTVGNDNRQLAPMSKKTMQVLGVGKLDVVADRGYFSSEQIKECWPFDQGLETLRRTRIFDLMQFRLVTIQDNRSPEAPQRSQATRELRAQGEVKRA